MNKSDRAKMRPDCDTEKKRKKKMKNKAGYLAPAII